MAGNVLGCWVFDICQNFLKLSFSSQTAKIFSWITEIPYTQSANIDLVHLPSPAFLCYSRPGMNQTIPGPCLRLCRQSSSRDKAAVVQRGPPGASLPPDTKTTSLWEEEFSWHEVGIRVQLAGLLCTSSFPKWSLTARAACIKLACVGSAFLLMHGWRTRSNQMQC